MIRSATRHSKNEDNVWPEGPQSMAAGNPYQDGITRMQVDTT